MGKTVVRAAARGLACAGMVALGVAGAGWPAAASGGGEGGGGGALELPPGAGALGGGDARPQSLSELPNTEQLLRAGSGARTAPPTPAARGGWNAERPVDELSFRGVADNGLRFGARIEMPGSEAGGVPRGPFGDFFGPPPAIRLPPLRREDYLSRDYLDRHPAPPAESATAPKGPPLMLRVDEATGQSSLLVRADFVQDGVPDFEAAARAYRDYYGNEPPFPVPPNPPRPGSAGRGASGTTQAPEESLQSQPGGGSATAGTGTQTTYITPRFSGFDLGVRYSPAGLETQLRGTLQSEDSALMESAIREFGTPEARAELDRQKAAQNQAAPQPRRAGGGR